MQDECSHWLALRLHFLLLWGSNWANGLCILPILGHLLSSLSLPPWPMMVFWVVAYNIALFQMLAVCITCITKYSYRISDYKTAGACMGIWLSLHVFYCSSYHTLKEKWGALVEGICLEAWTASCTCDTRYSYMYQLWTMHDCAPAMYAVP